MKNNKCFIDTSALMALNNPRDQYYKVASEIASTLDNMKLIISDPVLAETYRLLRYRLGYHTAGNFLKAVMAGSPFKIVEVTSDVRMATVALLEKFNDQKISYCDALSVAIMKEQKIDQIFTFDHHFEVMGVRVIR